MTATAKATPKVRTLADAMNFMRPRLDRKLSIHQRCRDFWTGVKGSRGLSDANPGAITAAFTSLARETRLVNDLGRDGSEMVQHLIWAGLRNFCPFHPR
jgi:hypothetical protein